MAADPNDQPQRTDGPVLDPDLEIRREWLLTNGRGGYASGTVLGVPTRRYHGLLVAAARPPLERWVMLSATLERGIVGGRFHAFGSFEFPHAFDPQGFRHVQSFTTCNRPPLPWARFVCQADGVRLVKQVFLPHGRDEVLVRYVLSAGPDEEVMLHVGPFTPLRDYHALTRAFPGTYGMKEIGGWIALDAYADGPRLWLTTVRNDGGEPAQFDGHSDWWYGLLYRQEAARGLEAREDLFVPGWFRACGRGTIDITLRAAAAFGAAMDDLPDAPPPLSDAPETAARSVDNRLREAAGAFVVRRRTPRQTELPTLLAGYHWFGDWGRDTFISLPGLLLETGRTAEAIQILEVFASAEQDGLIPNRFSDYGEGRDYNSVDASLWFIHAADAACSAAGRPDVWAERFEPVCTRIVEAFLHGTRYGIRVEDDGLVTCGDHYNQVTWMDAKSGDVVFTPRHGKAVEINALWYHVLCLLARRADAADGERAARLRQLASQARGSFLAVFWNGQAGCLFDVDRCGWKDMAMRPNQILAVSLEHSPLDAGQQRSVLEAVTRSLLTPYGLRTLAPEHPSYQGRYEGNPFERDRACHQGTVWAWLIGPYVEAYLRVHGFAPEARRRMRELLEPLILHLETAGIGQISEMFDGDPPHTPRGCIAQAWSVAELIRAWHMTAPG